MYKSLGKIPKPNNEPIYSYAPGTEERKKLQKELLKMRQDCVDIPLIIRGEEIHTDTKKTIKEPHKKSSILAKVSQANEEHVKQAIQASLEVKKDWEDTPWEERAAIFTKAAELISLKYRTVINASTMLGQSKTAHQSEIDAVCELIDFLRFNAHYMENIYAQQPDSEENVKNYLEYRSLEGFVYAISPFNFTSIAGNLPSAPALVGNTVLWKPSSTSVLSNYYVMKVFQEAGLPPGVINFLPGSGPNISTPILQHPKLGGVHFTGSTEVFQHIWRTIGSSIQTYESYPRVVGETGGKNFVFAHSSSNTKALSTALIRGAFEYQGQKCSAASRAYIPHSLWEETKEQLLKELATIKMGDVVDFSNFMSAVIDEASFKKITTYIDKAKNSSNCKLIFGGEYSQEEGYFIQATVLLTDDPHYETMVEEIFGPVLTIYLYEDEKFEETLKLCERTSTYGLTGAIFSQDKKAIEVAKNILKYAAGNFYINDKPTGAVVNQQPFGGSRASGTNDKAGSYLNLLRWLSPRNVKENFAPPTDYRYPFLKKE